MTAPIAFMVMPFSRKPTGLIGEHIPAEVDFDALWERVYEPVLADQGFTAVRADRDVGALIIAEMIQRLTIADMVVVDLSLPNANVYYELGIRHAARKTGCVLVAADWAQPLFDVKQMRQLRFPLADGQVPDAAAAGARAVLGSQIKPLFDGTSPVFDAVPGYPDQIDVAQQSAFTSLVGELSDFDAAVKKVAIGPAEERAQRARELVAAYGHRPVLRDAVVQQLIRVLQDHVGWPELLAYVDTLPEPLRRRPEVVEKRSLALARTGDVAGSAAALQQLMEDHGYSSERWGLLGGRYKQLARDAVSPSERRRNLDKAIDAYERGMRLDLNDYYPASNLPRLLRLRDRAGDHARATTVALLTEEACERRLQLGADDGWARASLLGMAFFRGDVDRARELRDHVEQDDPRRWMLSTTIDDLRVDLEQQDDHDVRAALAEVLADLEAMNADA